jgi:hypothetical protein
MFALFDPKAIPGGVLADLAVFYRDLENRDKINEAIIKHLGDRISFIDLDDREHGFFAILLDNISEARGTLAWVKSQKGVSSARLELIEDIIVNEGMYDDQINKAISQERLSHPLSSAEGRRGRTGH